MFETKKLVLAKKFGCSVDALERGAGRMQGYIRKKGISVRNIIFALDFLLDTIQEEKQKDMKEVLQYHFRDPKHRQKEQQIIDLYLEGYGAQRISKVVKIPKSTIENFLRKNQIWR